jgi:hypothetical protein
MAESNKPPELRHLWSPGNKGVQCVLCGLWFDETIQLERCPADVTKKA